MRGEIDASVYSRSKGMLLVGLEDNASDVPLNGNCTHVNVRAVSCLRLSLSTTEPDRQRQTQGEREEECVCVRERETDSSSSKARIMSSLAVLQPMMTTFELVARLVSDVAWKLSVWLSVCHQSRKFTCVSLCVGSLS